MDLADDRLDLLLADADDRRPVLEDGLPGDAAQSVPKPKKSRDAPHWRRDDADPNDLHLQRWAVIAPEGREGDRLLKAIQPLMRLREDEQGAPARVYRVPPDMDAKQAAAWKESVYWSDEVSEAERPLYLLMLGDLDATSVDLQHALAVETRVGRLCLADLDGYDTYARKVVRYARSPTVEASPDLLFHVVEDGTRATAIGKLKLVTPALAESQRQHEKGRLPAASVQRIEPETVDAFLAADAGAGARPSVMMTVSHGLGAPKRGWKSLEEQRRRQGAMVFGQGEVLDAERMRGQPFLPGGMWFYLACFGAGTPGASVYHTWLEALAEQKAYGGKLGAVLESLPKSGERPFVAAMPQAALANPEGPLSVIGHVDLAWTYSFSSTEKPSESKSSRNLGAVHTMVRGSRAGVALDALMVHYREVNDRLMVGYQSQREALSDNRPDPTDLVQRANLWMLRNDLRGFVLLGDPAARLPLRDNVVRAAEPAPALSSTATSPEDAVLATLAGEETPRAVAARAGVPLETLWEWVHQHLTKTRAAR